MINIKRIERSSSSSSKEELEVSPGELGKNSTSIGKGGERKDSTFRHQCNQQEERRERRERENQFIDLKSLPFLRINLLKAMVTCHLQLRSNNLLNLNDDIFLVQVEMRV